MEHLEDKMRLDFDALVRLRFLGPALCNHGMLPKLLLTAAYCGYREQAPRSVLLVQFLRSILPQAIWLVRKILVPKVGT